MKTTITATVLTLGLMMSGVAFADAAKPVKHAKENIDAMTTQSIGENTDCTMPGANLKFASVCAPNKAAKYPENALSGMNLGY